MQGIIAKGRKEMHYKEKTRGVNSCLIMRIIKYQFYWLCVFSSSSSYLAGDDLLVLPLRADDTKTKMHPKVQLLVNIQPPLSPLAEFEIFIAIYICSLHTLLDFVSR